MSEIDDAVTSAPQIVIIGGGASGTLLAAQLLRKTQHPIQVTIIDPADELAGGPAYSEDHPALLLNVNAGRMSAFPDDTEHFLRWMRQHIDPATAPQTFAQRRHYRFYLQSILNEARTAALPRGQFQWIQDEAEQLKPGADSDEVWLKSGRRIRADWIILAVGNFPPATPYPDNLAVYQTGYYYYGNPWDAACLADLPAEAPVLLIGSGLTAVDITLLLLAQGHFGPIHMVSRHGLLPRSHSTGAIRHRTLELEQLPTSTRRLFQYFRREIEADLAQGYEWNGIMEAIRPLVGDLWSRANPTERARFLRHVTPYWNVHRHRIAPISAQHIREAQAAGRLIVHTGLLCDSAPSSQAARVEITIRGREDVERLVAARVINCIGPNTDYRTIQSPLIQQLLSTGIARPGAFNLGLDTGPQGALIDAQGRESMRHYAIGPVRKGEKWETTAIPEIRVQADDLAYLLLAHAG